MIEEVFVHLHQEQVVDPSAQSVERVSDFEEEKVNQKKFDQDGDHDLISLQEIEDFSAVGKVRW